MKPNDSENVKGTAKRVFLKNARPLAGQELDTLSDKEREFAQACRERGVWLELFCPDDTCFLEEERLRLPVFCEHAKHDAGTWLEIFCPQGSCEIREASNLP